MKHQTLEMTALHLHPDEKKVEKICGLSITFIDGEKTEWSEYQKIKLEQAVNDFLNQMHDPK